MTETEEKKIVERFADAQPGDWVWVLDRDMSIYDENRKYLGRGGYRLEPVVGRNRSSLMVGRYGGGVKYDLTTGIQRGNKVGWSLSIRGSKDREEDWWMSQRNKLAGMVRDCTDIEQLKSVAFLLGFDERPSE
jgi:PAS domain-containing protein